MTLRSCNPYTAISVASFIFVALLSADTEAQTMSDEIGGKDNNFGSHPVWQIMHGSTKRSVQQLGRVENPLNQRLVMPPLPGEQAYTDSLKKEDEFGTATTYGPNKAEDYQLLFPPLIELQRLAKSKPLQKMYKEMITSEIPVMGQTFMMVENGAASGYFQSLNLVSNTLTNVMQTNDFQMKIMDLTDPTGEMKNVWISDVFKKTQDGKQGWAAALLSAQGDKTEFDASGDKFDQDLKSEPFDFKVLSASAKTGGTNNQGNQDGKKILLSTMLFAVGGKGKPAEGDGFENKNIEELTKQFTDLVGDMEMSFDTAATGAGTAQNDGKSSARKIQIKRVAAGKNQNLSGKRTGLARAQWEETALVWEHFHNLLEAACKVWKDPKNLEKEPGEMETWSTIKELTTQDWERSSAPDIPMTLDALKMVFALFAKERHPSEFKCEELQATAEDMPDKLGELTTADLDNCGQKSDGPCLRNRIVLYMSYVIGRSRAIHEYIALYAVSKKFATSPAQQILLDRVFRDVVAELDLQEELVVNRRRWEETISFFGSYTQGRVGGSNPSGDVDNSNTTMGAGH